MDKEQLDFTEERKEQLIKLFKDYFNFLDEDVMDSYKDLIERIQFYLDIEVCNNKDWAVNNVLVKWSLAYYIKELKAIAGEACAGCAGRVVMFWGCDYTDCYHKEIPNNQKCPISKEACDILLGAGTYEYVPKDKIVEFLKTLLSLQNMNTQNNLDFLFEKSEEIAYMLDANEYFTERFRVC